MEEQNTKQITTEDTKETLDWNDENIKEIEIFG